MNFPQIQSGNAPCQFHYSDRVNNKRPFNNDDDFTFRNEPTILFLTQVANLGEVQPKI